MEASVVQAWQYGRTHNHAEKFAVLKQFEYNLETYLMMIIVGIGDSDKYMSLFFFFSEVAERY